MAGVRGRLFLLFVVFEIRQNREHAADHGADRAAKQKKLLEGTLHITTPFREQKRAYKKSMYNPLLKEGLTANTSKAPAVTPSSFIISRLAGFVKPFFFADRKKCGKLLTNPQFVVYYKYEDVLVMPMPSRLRNNRLQRFGWG